MHGPRMMVAINPAADLNESPLSLPGKPEPVAHKASAFTVNGPAGSVEMVPFYEVRDESYTTYLLRT